MIISQIFDMIDMGLVILDEDLRVIYWNRWMEMKSGIPSGRIIKSPVFESFPHLNNPRFLRNFKAVLRFGNFCFFSQKLHGYLFPFEPVGSYSGKFEYMQQSCTMGPLRDQDNSIKYTFIAVQDVTEVVSYEHKLLEMNQKDGLTGIYNRRFLETRLCEEFDRHKRYGRPLSLIMLDIDHFKKVNDRYGHQFGDEVLKAVSSKIFDMTRKTDFVTRYGGEEFCCLLPETPGDAAMVLAERFRKEVMEMQLVCNADPVKVTISLGVCDLDEEAEGPEELIKKADDALYEAKEAGRNRVAVHRATGGPIRKGA
jgi:diguanylate cyclase (GGDEF)-like protein